MADRRMKVGTAVECVVCARIKKPVGRDAAAATGSSLCDMECAGYWLEPLPGTLWPGEVEHKRRRGNG